MPLLAKFLASFVGILSKIRAVFNLIFKAVFGEINYQAPSWLLWCGVKLANLSDKAVKAPLQGVGIFALLFVLGVGGWQGYHWYKARPQPVLVKMTVNAPERTVIEENLPPNPLIIIFDKSVAPLELVGKVAKDGIDMMPKLVGEWRWTSENQLTFQPKTDWPVGEYYKVSFNKFAFKPKTALEQSDIQFAAPKFVASISTSEFYQDPTNPAQKKRLLI